MTMVDRISVLQEVWKFLSEAKEIFFHGTSSVLAKKILSQGFDPDPKQKVWSQDKAHLASFIGAYFTDNILTAVSAARNATDKFNGDMAFFTVQLETRTGLYDEDQLPEIQYQLGQEVLSIWGRRLVGSTAAAILQDKAALNDIVKNSVDSWFDYYCKFRPDKDLPQLTKQFKQKLRPLITNWAYTFMQEMAKTDDYKSDDFRLYPNKNSAIRMAVNKVMNAMRGKVARTSDWQKNIRIDEPVGFRGSNRILSLSVIPRHYGEYDIVPITLVYGDNKEFLKAWETKMGSRYTVERGQLQ